MSFAQALGHRYWHHEYHEHRSRRAQRYSGTAVLAVPAVPQAEFRSPGARIPGRDAR